LLISDNNVAAPVTRNQQRPSISGTPNPGTLLIHDTHPGLATSENCSPAGTRTSGVEPPLPSRNIDNHSIWPYVVWLDRPTPPSPGVYLNKKISAYNDQSYLTRGPLNAAPV